MHRLLATVAAAVLPAVGALASQGPGVGAGTASPLLQFVAAMIVVGLGATVVVVALVLMALGGGWRE